MSHAEQRHAQGKCLLDFLKSRHPVIKHARALDEATVEAALVAAHPDREPWLLRMALHQHLNSDAYLQSLARGGPRYTLEGTFSGEVDPDIRHHAHLLLKHHRNHRGRGG